MRNEAGGRAGGEAEAVSGAGAPCGACYGGHTSIVGSVLAARPALPREHAYTDILPDDVQRRLRFSYQHGRSEWLMVNDQWLMING